MGVSMWILRMMRRLGDAVDVAVALGDGWCGVLSTGCLTNVMLARNGAFMLDRSTVLRFLMGMRWRLFLRLVGDRAAMDRNAFGLRGRRLIEMRSWVWWGRIGMVRWLVFHGVTRDHNEGRRVLWLEYEAYSPMAEDVMLQIVGEMREKWEIGEVAVCHRTGRVDIGRDEYGAGGQCGASASGVESSLYFIDVEGGGADLEEGVFRGWRGLDW